MVSTASSPTMIGRTGELDILLDLERSARSGTPRAVIISGEAGIGKSRLVREFVERVDADAVVAVGECVDLGSVSVPFAPVRGIVRGLWESFGSDTIHSASGPGMSSLLALLPPSAMPDWAPPTINFDYPDRLNVSVLELLEMLSDHRPLVLVLEDLHWVDPATLSLMRYLLQFLRRGRILTVFTYRDEDIHPRHELMPVLAELDRGRGVARLELTRLDRGQVREQVFRITRRELPASEVDELLARSAGVPFLVEELAALPGETLPDTLRQLLLVRYHRLDDATRRFLRMLAAGGARVDHDVLVAVHDGDPAALDDAAARAVAAQLVETRNDAYRFRHALLQEAVYGELVPGERLRLHARYAEALTALRPESSAEIAEHWWSARDADRALFATLRALDDARSSFAHGSAGQLLERLIELWPLATDPRRITGQSRSEILLAAGLAWIDAGDEDRATALLERACDECLPEENRVRAAILARQAGTAYDARPARCRELAAEGLDLLGDSDDPRDHEVRVRLLALVGNSDVATGEYDTGIATIEKAVEFALQRGSRESAGYASTQLGMARNLVGDEDGAVEALRNAEEWTADDPTLNLRAGVTLGDALHRMGRFAEAIEVGEKYLGRARAAGLERSFGTFVLANLTDDYLAIGEWDRADEVGIRALATVGHRAFESYLLRRLAWLRLWRDEPGEVDELWERTVALDVLDSDLEERVGWDAVLAERHLVAGDAETAWRQLAVLAELGTEITPPDRVPLLVLGARAIAARQSAGSDEDERLLRTLWDDIPPTEISTRWRAAFQAELADAGDEADAVARWQEAVAAADHPVMQRHAHPYALYRLAAAELRTGERTDAVAHLEEARTASAALGAGLLERLIDELTARSGLEGPGAARARGRGPDALTEREEQVLALIAEGLSNGQIGQRLFISTKTVSVHVSAILRKLGVGSRTEAAVRAGARRD